MAVCFLVGREVKRTFSEFARFSTGLPNLQACEARSQNFSDCRYPLVGIGITSGAGREMSGVCHSATAYRAFTESGLSAASQATSHASISWR